MSQPLPPLFWRWAAWRLGHGPWKPKGPRSSPRPAEFPWAIPPRWWTAYKRMWPEKPPAPSPVQYPSIFAGTGLFCAWDPRAALSLAGLVRWIAVQAEGQSNGQPWTTPQTVADLKAAGFIVHVWEAAAAEGGAAVTRLGANGGYIGQGESGPQFQACRLLPPMTCAKAIVGNPTVLSDLPDAWPNDWVCLPEAYTNANPNATVAKVHYEAYKRGAKDIYPCFGVYDASAEQPGVGKRIPLETYYHEWQKLGLQGWNGYLAETLTDADVAFLAGLR